MTIKEGQWCYSFNGENFEGNFDTKEEAIEEASYEFEEYYKEDQNCFWVGQIKEVGLGVNVDWLLDDLRDQAYEEAGDCGEDYLENVTTEQARILEDKLNDILYNWMETFNHKPNFYAVRNVEKIRKYKAEFAEGI